MLRLYLFTLVCYISHITQTICQISIRPTLQYNRYLVVNSMNADIHDHKTGPAYKPYWRRHLYELSFTDILSLPKKIYYVTQNIQTKIFNQQCPNDPQCRHLQYYLNTKQVTNTSITVQISGFFQKPLFRKFFLRILFVFDNPWTDNYMIIQELVFSNGSNKTSTKLPNKYSPGNSLSYSIQFRDIKAQFTRQQLLRYNSQFQILWIPNLTNISLEIDLQVSPFLETVNNGNYRIRYLVVIIALSELYKDYPQYLFQIDTKDVNVAASFSMSLNYSQIDTYSNFLLGLSQFRNIFDNRDQFNYGVQDNSNSIICHYYDRPYASTYFSYSYIFLVYLQCKNQTYYKFNSTDYQCYSDPPCLNGSYKGNNQSCLPCRFDCLTCQNQNQCLSCNTTYRVLQKYSCIPLPGLYQSNTTIPINCSLPCITCFGNRSNCTSCVSNNKNLLVNGSCIPCSSRIEGCDSCTQLICISCLANYTLINNTYCNLPCADPNCLVCSNSNTSHCFSCEFSQHEINSHHKCVQKQACGDGILAGSEQCDDGNRINHDGCDWECLIESNYRCYRRNISSGVNYTNYCAFIHPIEFTVISVEKLPYENRIQLLISVSHYLEHFWRTQIALKYCFVESPIPYRNMQISFKKSVSRRLLENRQKLAPTTASTYPSESLMEVSFEYLSSLQNQPISVGFKFNNSLDLTLAQIPPSSVTLTVHPGNNHLAYLYSLKMYNRQKMLQNCLSFIAYVMMAMLLVGYIVGGKRVAAEALVVLQVAYASLLTVPKISPMFVGLEPLSVAGNGINMLYDPYLRPFEDVLSDQRVKGAGMYSQFLCNVNTGLLMIILPLLVGLVSLIVSKLRNFSEDGMKKIRKVCFLAVGEYTFVGLVSISTMVGVSLSIQIKFGLSQNSTIIGILSLIFTFILPFIYIFYSFIRLNKYEYFEQYEQLINKKQQRSYLFQLFTSLLGLLIGVLIGSLYKFKYINLIILIFPLVKYILTLFNNYYIKLLDHYRTQLNLLTIIFTQLIYLYVNMRQVDQYKSEEDNIILIPIALLILLGINFIVNMGYFIYLIIKKIRLYRMQNQSRQKQIINYDERNEFNEFLYKSASMIPVKLIQSPNIRQFKDTFMEQDEATSQQSKRLKQTHRKIKRQKYEVRDDDSNTRTIIYEQDYIVNKMNGDQI